MTLRFVSSISSLGMVRFHLGLHQFVSVHLAANEYQHFCEGTCDGLASCPGQSVQLHYKLLALKPGLSSCHH